MIVNDEQRRAMEFVAFVNRGGYRPTGREINEWRLRPEPRKGQRGQLLEAGVPAVPERRVRVSGPSSLDIVLSGFTKQLSVLAHSAIWTNPGLYGAEYKVVPGKPGKPAVYGPEKPPEKFLAHLRRLGWVERDAKGRYSVTLLGHALLRSEAANELGDDDSSVMVLAADDELAYGRVLGVIAECGDAFIMDAYLGTNELVTILKHTSATRFLVGERLPKSRLTELALQIELTPPGLNGETRELRQASFHDRWVVGDHKLYGLGASFNGVGGSSTTTLVEMPDVAARVIRPHAEDLWTQAKIVTQTRQVDDEPEEGAKVIREEADRFTHGGCNIRHKTMRAAENCTNGS